MLFSNATWTGTLHGVRKSREQTARGKPNKNAFGILDWPFKPSSAIALTTLFVDFLKTRSRKPSSPDDRTIILRYTESWKQSFPEFPGVLPTFRGTDEVLEYSS